MDSNFMRKITIGPDARSTRGIFSRGSNVYRGASKSANRGLKLKKTPSKEAISRRMKKYA